MRRALGVILVLAGLLATVLVAGATAQPPGSAEGISAGADSTGKRFARLLGASNYTNFRPAAAAANGPVRVLVALDGASVAQHEANAIRAGVALSDSQRSSIR